MNQQRSYARSKWVYPSLGIFNLPIAAIALAVAMLRISMRLLRFAFRGLSSVNRVLYHVASRAERWAVK